AFCSLWKTTCQVRSDCLETTCRSNTGARKTRRAGRKVRKSENFGDCSKEGVLFSSVAGLVQDLRDCLTTAGLLIALEVQGQSTFERLLGADPIHRLLHLAH